MAQGKEWNKEDVIEVMKPFFKMGCSVTKACSYAGMPQSTVATWIKADEVLRLKIGIWQNEPSVMARSNWLAKLAEGDYESAKEWLRRKEKDEFSERQEVTGADGKDLPVPILNGIYSDNSTEKDSSTQEED